ncbi:melanoma inhibitory activity protein 2 [Bombina bombina]|uniref:melanoma inhibitory activity protein 2 n=1 Tax=Bombina bombina TaxID=8345 RepID=UPI00235AE43B|nr:melanoma inhibitory activity protein 2 [Bombina bombina]
MKELLVYRYVFLFLMFYTHIQSQKILSEKKKCGDPQCESLMMRAQANQDYNGPDCRFLSFKSGDEINVYYKLSGKREDLWQGSKGKSYGFFPKDTVNIEEVFLKEEVEVFAQEIDFICLDGGEYVFENEDSVLHKPKENEYSDIYLERTDHEIVGKQDQEIKGNAQVEATLQASEHNVAESDLDKSTWTVSGIGSWFGIGKTEDKEAAKTAEEPLKEDTFLGRKITVTEETGFEDAGDEQPEENGWFSGRFTQFLPFGAKESEIEKNSDSLKRSSNIEIDAVGQENYASEKEESILEAKHEPKDQDDSQAKWFNFGFKNMLGFGDKNKDKQDFHETSEETIKTKSPDDVPLNRNAQGEKTDVFGTDSEQPDKLKEITDAKQEVNPENISLNKTTEKGGSDATEISNHLNSINLEDRDPLSDHLNMKSIESLTTDPSKILDNLSNKETQLQDKSEPVNLGVSSDTVDHKALPWFKSILTNYINFKESNSVELRTNQDQSDLTDSLHEIQTPDSEDTNFDKVIEENRDPIVIHSINGKDVILSKDIKHSEETILYEEKLASEKESIHSLVDNEHTIDNINIKDFEQEKFSQENDLSVITSNTGSSQEPKEHKNMQEKNSEKHNIELNVSAISNEQSNVNQIDESAKRQNNPIGNNDSTNVGGFHLSQLDVIDSEKMDEDTLGTKQDISEVKVSNHKGDTFTLRPMMNKIKEISDFEESGINENPMKRSEIDLEEKHVNTMSNIEVVSDMSKINTQEVSTATTGKPFESICLECKTDVTSVFKENGLNYINLPKELLETFQMEEEEEYIAFKKTERQPIHTRADKETLDLSLEHRDIHEQKSYTKSEKPSASSFLSFSDVVLFWETTCSKVVAVYTKLETPDLSPLIAMIHKVASYLPEDMQPGSHFYGHPWDVVIFTVVLGFFILLLFTCRAVKAIKSRGYARRESKYVAKVAELLDNKSEVLKKLSIVKKEYDELQLSLQDSGHQKLLSEISDQKTLQENLESTNLDLEENIRRLEHAFEEEKRFSSELDDELAEMNATIRTLEEEINNGSSQKEEIRTTLKVFEINQERIETSLQDNIEENIQLQESIKQLSNEDEGWEERFSELSENSKMLSSSVDEMREDLTNKQSQIKLLIDSLLKMKDWSSVLDEVDESDDSSVPSINMDFENGEPLGDPQKRTIKKLIVAAMLNASLRTVETEKKQLYDNLTDEMKAKQQLFECIENLQNTKHSLSLEKEKLGSEVEELKQKMNVMSEKHEESETKLHRKLTVQEKQRVQKEEKLSKVDEKFSLAAEELLAIKTRVKELEEEMEKTVCSYRNQVSSYEKKSHDNWNGYNSSGDPVEIAGNVLTEADYKLNLLEKDPYALDVIHAIGRENSPFGPSPVGRIQDNRTFLSPPTLMEGPPRHSPMIPGADGGMRPPGYYPGYPGTKEQMDIIADRKTDHHRTLSDSGSLSPPWERNQKINFPPSGLSYQEHPFPPRRPERFYQYPAPSGRFSGPAELTRNQGKPFMDEPEGRSSPEYKARVNTSRNGSEENETLPSQPYLNEGQTVDGQQVFHGVLPPPQMRIPLLPMEPRGPYFRRPFPIPPPRMDMFRPQDYPGFPPILGPLRGPNPLHHYPPQMHRDPFFPPHHLRPPPPRSEYPPHPITQPPGDDNDKLPEPKT